MSNEIDLYSQYQLCETRKERKEKIKKMNYKKMGLWGAILIAIGLFAVLFLANAFSNILAFSTVSIFSNNSVVEKGYKAYMIEIANLPNELDAQSVAVELQLKGGAGYIFEDSGFHVFASAYLSIADAEAVLQKVKGEYPNAKIYNFEINRIELENVDKFNTDGSINDGLNIFKNIFKDLYNASVELDKLQKTSVETKNNLLEIHEKACDISNNFNNSAIKVDDTKIVIVKAQIDLLVKKLNSIVEVSLSSNRLSSLIKKVAIDCLVLQNDLGRMVA